MKARVTIRKENQIWRAAIIVYGIFAYYNLSTLSLEHTTLSFWEMQDVSQLFFFTHQKV